MRGVTTEPTKRNGLKERTAVRILLDIEGRVRTSIPMLLRVAVTARASLLRVSIVSEDLTLKRTSLPPEKHQAVDQASQTLRLRGSMVG